MNANIEPGLPGIGATENHGSLTPENTEAIVALSPEVLARLEALGYSSDAQLQVWRGLWESEGEASVRRFIEIEEEVAAEYRHWFPRLQAFAAECRRAAPIADVHSLSVKEREQHRILLLKMREFAESADRRLLDRRPNRAAIVSSTQVGLIAANAMFSDSGAVILQESEQTRWFSEVYSVESAFWWYAVAWWTLKEDLPAEDAQYIQENFPIPAGSSYWVMTCGVQWSSMAGGADHELWRWDGEQAEFIEVYRREDY